jgi:outer membrane protein assembly factor BamB
MEDEHSSSFEEFSVEMGDFEVKRVGKFDRMWKTGSGGSMLQHPLLHDGKVYFGSFNNNVYCVDAKTGGLVWKFRCDSMIGESSPHYWNGCIYFGSFDQNFYCIDAKTGALRWKFWTNDVVYSECAIAQGRVFFGGKDRFVYCLDAKTGALVWKFETFDEIISVPAFREGRLFVGSTDHNLYCFDAATGNVIWKVPTQGEVHNMNAFEFHEGKLFFASFDNFVRAVSIKTGDILWKFPTGQYGNGASPVVHEGLIYHSSRDGNLFCLTPGGELVWKYDNTKHMGIPFIYRGRMYLGSEDLNLHCFSLSGEKLWSFKTEGAVFIRCAAEGDTLFFTSCDCFLYALDLKTRDLLWKFRADGAPAYLPPPYESFEMVMKIGRAAAEDAGAQEYVFGAFDVGRNVSAYKSDMTYQSSTTYRSKGKYQVDADKEGF